MVQGKITKADTTTIRVGITPSRVTSDSPLSSPIFMPDALPCRDPATLSWLGTGTKCADFHTSGMVDSASNEDDILMTR